MNNIKKSAKNLKKYGRNGDTLLAHITPAEANLLKNLGGSSTINPITGLPEFFGGFGGFFSGITNAISDVLGTSGGGGGILGGAEDLVQGAGNVLADVDKFVNREIPGGWVTVGLTAAGAYAYTEAADAAIATGATLAEAEAAGAIAAASAEAAEAAALAEGGVTAGMAGAANTGLPVGTQTLGGTVGATAGGAPIFDYSTEATLTPGGNVVPATTLPTEMAAIDAEIASAGAEAAKALPMKISPFQAIQGIRSASGLLGGGQQQQAQAYPQMQMGGRTQMPQGAVDYSGLYNLLALQRARNPNSLLG